MLPDQLAIMIDHTALKPETTAGQVVQLCEEARHFGFAAACVAPAWVPLAVKTLAGNSVKVASVAGFPHGNTVTDVKTFEAHYAIQEGAQEIDMVIHAGALKSGDIDAVFEDIFLVTAVARHSGDIVVKVILETALLTEDEKVLVCQLAEKAGADFVKTSTGFAAAGATVADVALMRRVVGDRLGVKAAGGIRDLATARAMIAAGATRLGSSASVAIMQALQAETGS